METESGSRVGDGGSWSRESGSVGGEMGMEAGMDTSSFRAHLSKAIFPLLFRSLETAGEELYALAEFTSNLEAAKKALRLLQTTVGDFGELVERLEMMSEFERERALSDAAAATKASEWSSSSGVEGEMESGGGGNGESYPKARRRGLAWDVKRGSPGRGPPAGRVVRLLLRLEREAAEKLPKSPTYSPDRSPTTLPPATSISPPVTPPSSSMKAKTKSESGSGRGDEESSDALSPPPSIHRTTPSHPPAKRDGESGEAGSGEVGSRELESGDSMSVLMTERRGGARLLWTSDHKPKRRPTIDWADEEDDDLPPLPVRLPPTATTTTTASISPSTPPSPSPTPPAPVTTVSAVAPAPAPAATEDRGEEGEETESKVEEGVEEGKEEARRGGSDGDGGGDEEGDAPSTPPTQVIPSPSEPSTHDVPALDAAPKPPPSSRSFPWRALFAGYTSPPRVSSEKASARQSTQSSSRPTSSSIEEMERSVVGSTFADPVQAAAEAAAAEAATALAIASSTAATAVPSTTTTKPSEKPPSSSSSSSSWKKKAKTWQEVMKEASPSKPTKEGSGVRKGGKGVERGEEVGEREEGEGGGEREREGEEMKVAQEEVKDGAEKMGEERPMLDVGREDGGEWSVVGKKGKKREKGESALSLHERLSSPDRHLMRSEAAKRAARRQAAAEEARKRTEAQRQKRREENAARAASVERRRRATASARETAVAARHSAAERRHARHIEGVRRRAEEESLKVSEVGLINELQAAGKRQDLDRKLLESGRRRKERLDAVAMKASRHVERTAEAVAAARAREEESATLTRARIATRLKKAETRRKGGGSGDGGDESGGVEPASPPRPPSPPSSPPRAPKSPSHASTSKPDSSPTPPPIPSTSSRRAPGDGKGRGKRRKKKVVEKTRAGGGAGGGEGDAKVESPSHAAAMSAKSRITELRKKDRDRRKRKGKAKVVIEEACMAIRERSGGEGESGGGGGGGGGGVRRVVNGLMRSGGAVEECLGAWRQVQRSFASSPVLLSGAGEEGAEPSISSWISRELLYGRPVGAWNDTTMLDRFGTPIESPPLLAPTSGSPGHPTINFVACASTSASTTTTSSSSSSSSSSPPALFTFVTNVSSLRSIISMLCENEGEGPGFALRTVADVAANPVSGAAASRLLTLAMGIDEGGGKRELRRSLLLQPHWIPTVTDAAVAALDAWLTSAECSGFLLSGDTGTGAEAAAVATLHLLSASLYSAVNLIRCQAHDEAEHGGRLFEGITRYVVASGLLQRVSTALSMLGSAVSLSGTQLSAIVLALCGVVASTVTCDLACDASIATDSHTRPWATPFAPSVDSGLVSVLSDSTIPSLLALLAELGRGSSPSTTSPTSPSSSSSTAAPPTPPSTPPSPTLLRFTVRTLLVCARRDVGALLESVRDGAGALQLHHGLGGALMAVESSDSDEDGLIADTLLLADLTSHASPEARGAIVFGRAPTPLTRMLHLPLPWFSEPLRKRILLPTLIAAVGDDADTLERISANVSIKLLRAFASAPAKRLPQGPFLWGREARGGRRDLPDDEATKTSGKKETEEKVEGEEGGGGEK